MRRSPLEKLGRVAALAVALFATRTAASASALDEGLAALDRTEYEAAERALGEAAKTPATRARALLGLARVEHATGRLEAAIAHADDAAHVDAGLRPEALAWRAEWLHRRGRDAEALAVATSVASEKGARRARVVLGELLLATGHRGEAREPLMSLVREYNDRTIGERDAEGLFLVGRAAAALGGARDANDAYAESERAGPKRVETLLARAELFLDKHDPGHAAETVKDALAVAPRSAAAHAAAARVKLAATLDFGAAEREIEAALAVDPTLPSAWALRADLALRASDVDGAARAVERGLHESPGDLGLLSMRGAVRFLAGDASGFEASKAEVLAKNPEYARFFVVVADLADWEHRYEEIVAMMREASRIDDKDARVLSALGINLIRGGDDAGGLDALRRAFARDRFDVRVYNTLNLYEREIGPHYASVTHGPFTIRLHESERAILERYVPAMLDRAFGSLRATYGVTPRAPLGVELYASAESFAIRTSGLPNVGIQGVCFGRTLAAMSPKAEPFNWGNVLWHELSHVFAIELSKRRVPRWLTEGLSEVEAARAEPTWDREDDASLFEALRAGRVPRVAEMSRFFTHATDAGDVVTAYYASSRLVRFMVERHGMPKIVRMLALLGDGARAEEALSSALGVGVDELDAEFRAAEARELRRFETQFVPIRRPAPLDEAKSRVVERPDDAAAHASLAFSWLAARRPSEAEAALARALELSPIEPDALFLAAELAEKRGEAAEAARRYGEMIRYGYDGFTIRMRLAELAEGRHDLAALRVELETASAYDPTAAPPVAMLAKLAEKQGRDDDALAALRALVRIDQHDRRAHLALLERLVARGLFDEARRVGELAMYVDVESAPMHVAYARALAGAGDRARALFELESARLCHPPPKLEATTWGLAARELAAAGRAAEARSARDRALALDPEEPTAKELRIR